MSPWMDGDAPGGGCTFSEPKHKAAPGGAPTPTGSLTTRRAILLMADQNPTARRATVSPAPFPSTVVEMRNG